MYVIRDKKSKAILHMLQSVPGESRDPEEIFPDFDAKTMEFGHSDGPGIPAWFTIDDGKVKRLPPSNVEAELAALPSTLDQLKATAVEHLSRRSFELRQKLIPDHEPLNAALAIYNQNRTDAIGDTTLAFGVSALPLEASAARAATWAVPALNSSGIFSDASAVVYDAARHKLYVGHLTDAGNRRGLMVFDTDSQGNPVGISRRYLSHPNVQPGGTVTWIRTIFLDTRHNKLFIGTDCYEDAGMTTPLVMYNLDATGEPAGSPQAFATGNPNRTVYAVVLHPTLNRLYTVGWGGGAVYARNLDANGVPIGAPVALALGTYGPFSLSLRADGTKLYAGTYPNILQVIDLDANGNKVGSTRSYTASNYASTYLLMTANACGIYYKDQSGYIRYWHVTADGEPTDAPVATALAVQWGKATANNTLIASEDVPFTDALTGLPKVSGVKVREYALNTDGSIGAVQQESAAFDRQRTNISPYTYFYTLNTEPNTALITTSLAGFRGNRIGNLSLRTTLLFVEETGEIAPVTSSAALSSQSVYLQFSYSPRWGMVYAADGSNINVHTLSTGTTANVTCANATQAILVDDQAGTYGKVYVALTNGNIDIRDLNANGVPSSTANVITTGMSKVATLAVNIASASRCIYLCGSDGTAGTIAGTNLIKVPVSYHSTSAAVNSTKNRLYITSQYNTNSNLWVWTLNSDGTLNGSSATAYPDGIPIKGPNPLRGKLSCVVYNSTKNRLYIAGNPETLQGARQGWLIVHTPDANGDPTDTPRIYPTPNTAGENDALALSADGKWLYESGWGDNRVFAQALDGNGEPTGSEPLHWTYGIYGKECLNVIAHGTKLLTGTYPSTLHQLSLLADGTAAVAPIGTLTFAGQTINYGPMAVGAASSWTNLNAALQNGSYTALGTLTFTGGTISRATLRFDFSLDGGMTTLASRTCDVKGNGAALYLPQYDMNSDKLTKYAYWLMDSGLRYREFLSTSQLDTVRNCDRPQQFIVTDTLFSADASAEAVIAGTTMLGLQGHNTLQVSGSMLAADDVHNAIQGAGAKRVKYAIYNPPSYFDYNTESFIPGYQDNWAAGYENSIANAMGAKPDELALFHMADEPGWYFPGVLNDVTDPTHTERLGAFRTFLQTVTADATYFGGATAGDWTNPNIKPVGQSVVYPPATATAWQKHLYYWTCRFYAQSCSKAFAASTAAMQRQFGSGLFTTTNLNNWPGRYYVPSPNQQIANNTIVGPDSALGMPDWFDLGRNRGVSAIWTEDWFSDTAANKWSMYADLMRCAARENTGVEYGGYVVGQSSGQVTDGLKYKVMALIGHGAKAGVDSYTFGPWPITGDSWSENSVNTYKGFADAFRLLGKSESVLYPGRPRTGTVAILLPKASQPWDMSQGLKVYMYELYGLYYALTHAQYPVDFVDDDDIEAGKLVSYGYEVLYVTAPNLSAAVQDAILSWVNAGRHLVMLPGAGAADEHNDASTILQGQMGASWGAVARQDYYQYATWRLARTVVTVTDSTTLGATTDETQAQLAPLTVTTATSLATMPGGSAVTRRAYGTGYIWAYGYWPGTTYFVLMDPYDATKLPTDWRTDTRQILTAPCRSAATQKFVACNVPVVECPLLEDVNAGIGITLLNWNGLALDSITVSVSKLAMPVAILNKVNTAIGNGTLKVSSVEQEDLTYTVNSNNIDVTLPLSTVDVLTLTW